MLNEKETREQLAAMMGDVTMDNLLQFMGTALNRPHDYGTICVAIGACAVAAAKAADRSEHGGITGFQAGAIFWEFQRGWGVFGEGPMRMVTYKDMLYPQYDDKFGKTISAETWKWLQDEAAKNLAKEQGHEAVRAHWQTIVDGAVPVGYTVSED